MGKTPLFKSAIKAIGLVAACTIAATPAFAEGSWSGSISGANSGFGSRTWTDKNSDAVANGGRLTRCSKSNAGMAFYRNRQFPVPDEVVGMQKESCDYWVGYKRTSGAIHFVLKNAGSTGSFSSRVAIQY